MFSEGKIKFNNWHTAILTTGKTSRKRKESASLEKL